MGRGGGGPPSPINDDFIHFPAVRELRRRQDVCLFSYLRSWPPLSQTIYNNGHLKGAAIFLAKWRFLE